MLKTAAAAVMLISSFGFAQECALDAKNIAPQYSAKQLKGAKVLSTKKEKRKIRQTLKLADATEVTVEFGGCDHVEYAFIIKTQGLNTKTVGAEVLAIARRVLPQLTMNSSALAEPKVLLSALDEGSFVSLPATISCGSNGTCRIELVAEPSKGKKPAPKKKEKGKDEPKPDDADGPATLKLSYDAPI